MAWILAYWIRKLGREPGENEIEPLTRGWCEAGRSVPADRYLLLSRSSGTRAATWRASCPTTTPG